MLLVDCLVVRGRLQPPAAVHVQRLGSVHVHLLIGQHWQPILITSIQSSPIELLVWRKSFLWPEGCTLPSALQMTHNDSFVEIVLIFEGLPG